METVKLDSSEDRFIISIDKKFVNKGALLRFLEDLKLEALADSVDFKNDIEEIGEQIKKEWWEANKDRFIADSNE